MSDAEHVKIVDLGQRPMMIDGVRNRGIVVAGQEHHRQRRRGDDRRGAIEQVSGQPMAIEGVAGEHDGIRGDGAGRVQHPG